MTIAYNPFRDVDRLSNQLARSAAADVRSMPMDLYRDGDNFVVKIDLPGVSADSIDIDVDDRTLTVRAEREQLAVPAPALANVTWAGGCLNVRNAVATSEEELRRLLASTQ